LGRERCCVSPKNFFIFKKNTAGFEDKPGGQLYLHFFLSDVPWRGG
jgi:hypothetical protein